MGFGVLFGYTGTLVVLFLSPYIVHIKTTYAQRTFYITNLAITLGIAAHHSEDASLCHATEIYRL